MPDAERETSLSMAHDFLVPMPPRQRLAFATLQCYLALASALYGAESLGLDSCPMDGFDQKAVSEILAIPPPLVPVMLCPIGYAPDQPGPRIRYPLEEILI